MNEQKAKIAWVQGYLAAKIEGFSHSLNIAPELFAEGLAGAIRNEGQRTENPMPVLRQRNSPKLRKVMGETMEVRKRSHSDQARPMSEMRKKMASYWQKTFPTKAARRAEVARRQALGKKRSK